ncbi:ORF3 [torque teno Delphinidae virus 44]
MRRQRSSTGNLSHSPRHPNAGRGCWTPTAGKPLARGAPSPMGTNANAVRNLRTVPYRSVQTGSPPSGDRGRNTESPPTALSAQWTPAPAALPATRSSPAKGQTAPKTPRPADASQTARLQLGLIYINMPKPLPPSKVPPIPLPFSMNIHQ